jgi:hypothetical protein
MEPAVVPIVKPGADAFRKRLMLPKLVWNYFTIS